MNNKKINRNYLKLFFYIAFFLLPFFVFAANTTYVPMENIPGAESQMTGDFYTYISGIYKFGIWAVGIAAFFMIIFGGFMYITSAGNNASMEKAKGVITDALVGLLLAMLSYLLLYIINPDLVRINPASTGTTPPATQQPGGAQQQQQGTQRPAATTGGDTCTIYQNTNNVVNFATTTITPLPSSCSQYSFQNSSGVDEKILKSIAATESTCTAGAASGVGSCGLMQLQPSTAQNYNPQATSCAWLQANPQESIRIAAQYIAANSGSHGYNLEKLFAGYNGGYGSSINSSGKKGPLAPSSDCPGSLAYQCCKNPGELAETQDYIFKNLRYYNGQ